MSTGHAPFAPSAAKRWMTCTASFGLGLQMPEPPESAYATEGSRLHDVAAAALRERDLSDAGFMDQEDYAALKPYFDYALKRINAAVAVRIEEWIEHSALLSGTPDLSLLFGGKADMLEIIDLKSGAGIKVEPEENAQLLTYAYMELSRLLRLKHPIPKHVRLTIVQPPDEERPVKSWATTSDHVMRHGVLVNSAIKASIEGQGEYVPGDHCRWCKAKPICPRLRGEVVEALAGVPPSAMTHASLAQWLDRAERMEGFIGDLRNVAHGVATLAQELGTQAIPGWRLKPKRAMRQWADEDEVLKIARRRKIKIWQDKLMSPAMAEKAHPNMPEELTKQIVSVSSGLNLVRMSPAEVEAQKLEVKKPEDNASKLQKMMANMSLAKLRR